MEIDTGGDAFPMASVSDCYPGMTLRDWFAGLAMNGTISDPNVRDTAESIAKASYILADAMIKAQKGE